MILEDQIVQLSYFENNSQPAHEPTVFEHTRPDLRVTDHATKTCLTVEVSVLLDVSRPDLLWLIDHATKTCLSVEVSVPLDISRPDYASKTCLSIKVSIPLDVSRPVLCVIDRSCDQNVFVCWGVGTFRCFSIWLMCHWSCDQNMFVCWGVDIFRCFPNWPMCDWSIMRPKRVWLLRCRYL